MDEREAVPRVRVEPGFGETWPGASALATDCVLNLGALANQMAAFGEGLARQHGIHSLAGLNVLTILHGAGEALPPSTIAERMIVSRPTMTRILRSLERDGLVRRLAHPGDRRMALLEVTATGVAGVERLRPELHAAERRWMGCLSADEQQLLLGMLARLQANEPSARADAARARVRRGRSRARGR